MRLVFFGFFINTDFNILEEAKKCFKLQPTRPFKQKRYLFCNLKYDLGQYAGMFKWPRH